MSPTPSGFGWRLAEVAQRMPTDAANANATTTAWRFELVVMAGRVFTMGSFAEKVGPMQAMG